MNKLKYIFLMAFSAIIILSSCKRDEKFFSLERPPQNPWNNLNDINQSVLETYRHFMGSEWDGPAGFFMKDFLYYSDLMTMAPTYAGGNQYNRTLSNDLGELNAPLQHLYQAVNAVNGPLGYLDKVEKSGVIPFGLTEKNYRATANQYKGELYFLRGLAYWYMVRWFCPPFNPTGTNDSRKIVLKTVFSQNLDSLRNGYLATAKEIYKQIESDWEMSRQLLPKTTPQSLGRMNRYNVFGYFSRYYFLTGNWPKAQAMCDSILNPGGSTSTPYPLQAEPMDAFNKSGMIAPASEVIWELEANANSLSGCKLVSYFSLSHYNCSLGGRGSGYSYGWAQALLTKAAVAKMGWMTDPVNGNYAETQLARDDKRYASMSVINASTLLTSPTSPAAQRGYWRRLEAYKAIPGGSPSDTAIIYKNKYPLTLPTLNYPTIWVDKYYRATNPTGATPRWTNKVMLRSAEIYLTRAILRLRAGDKDGAVADVNVVRARARLGNTMDPLDPSQLSVSQIEDAIERERIIELSDENGDRVWYLISLRKSIEAGDRPAASLVNPPYNELFWPLPLGETQYNLGLQ